MRRRLLRKAHVLRYEMTAARLEAASIAAEASAPLPGESSRVESSVVADAAARAGTAPAAQASAANPGPTVPAARHHASPRVESSPQAPAPAPRPQPPPRPPSSRWKNGAWHSPPNTPPPTRSGAAWAHRPEPTA
ncbi:hypothetical protein ACWC9T_36690 [Kitasatospora sp. NPDC001159]